MLYSGSRTIFHFFASACIFMSCSPAPSSRDLKSALDTSENANGNHDQKNATDKDGLGNPVPPASTPVPASTNEQKETPPTPVFTVKRMGGSFTYTRSMAADSQGNLFIGGYAYNSFDGNVKSGKYDFFITKLTSTYAKLWSRQVGTNTGAAYNGQSIETRGHSISVDKNGNAFIVGFTNGNLDGNTRTGDKDLFVTKFSGAGEKLWTRQIGVAGKNTVGISSVADAAGNIYASGYTEGALPGNTVAGHQDFLILKIDKDGKTLWIKQAGMLGRYSYGTALAMDSSGSVIAAGHTSGLSGYTSVGLFDTFVAKYSSLGVNTWVRFIGSPAANVLASTVALDKSSNIFVSGATQGGIDANVLVGKQDWFIGKFDSAGAKKWFKQSGGKGFSAEIFSSTVDSDGNIIATGSIENGVPAPEVSNSNSTNLLLIKMAADGSPIWTRQHGDVVTVANAVGYGVVTDGANNILVAGTVEGVLDGFQKIGSMDLFLMKFSNAGN